MGVNFCTNKCVTKNTVGVLNGRHFVVVVVGTKGVNPEELAS